MNVNVQSIYLFIDTILVCVYMSAFMSLCVCVREREREREREKWFNYFHSQRLFFAIALPFIFFSFSSFPGPPPFLLPSVTSVYRFPYYVYHCYLFHPAAPSISSFLTSLSLSLSPPPPPVPKTSRF